MEEDKGAIRRSSLTCFFAESSTNDPAVLNKPAVLNTANSSDIRVMTFYIIVSICYRCDSQHDSTQRDSKFCGRDLVLQTDLVLQIDVAEHRRCSMYKHGMYYSSQSDNSKALTH